MTIINYEKLMEQDPFFLGTVTNQKNQTVDFYEHPTKGEYSPIIGVIENVSFDTGFFDLSDFYPNSDYNPILHCSQSVDCAFEVL